MVRSTPNLNNYEFALHGLLALSATATARDPTTGSPLVESGVPVTAHHASQDTNNVNTTESHGTSLSASAEPCLSIAPGEAQAEHVVNMMKVYRYQIAPWLDILDSNQTFGVLVLYLSTESQGIRNEVLKLAETVQTTERSESSRSDTVYCTEPVLPLEAFQTTISRVFGLLEEVTLDLTHFWEVEGVSQNGRRVLETFPPRLDEGSPLTNAAYWLVVRLVLSCALMFTTTPIQLPLPEVVHNHPGTTTNSETSSIAQKALMLCVEAAMFSQGGGNHDFLQHYGMNRSDTWKVLIGEFGTWFKYRPEEFQPIIELYAKDGIQTDNDFPIIVFTSGAALLANQLYHTGMMLLLQHQPRFGNNHSSSSSFMSILWHVHRICGIATQNDGAATWDPCLVASVIVAARTLTHRSQQMAVVNTLETAQRLTGWNVLDHIEELNSEWRLADGW